MKLFSRLTFVVYGKGIGKQISNIAVDFTILKNPINCSMSNVTKIMITIMTTYRIICRISRIVKSTVVIHQISYVHVADECSITETRYILTVLIELII